MKNGARIRSSMNWMYSATSSWLCTGWSSSRNSSPLIRDSMSDSRKVMPSRLRHLHQQRIADRVAVIVVDVLEIVDVEEGEREACVSLANGLPLQQLVDAMLDHPPRRQAGQFVIIGRAEQRVLEGLLLGDVGGAGQQQVAAGDANRPVAGQEYLLARSLVGGLFLRPRRGRRAAIRRRFRGARPFPCDDTPAS